MTLTQRKNGYFYIYYELNGIRKAISTKTKTKKEATEFLSNFQKELKERFRNHLPVISLKEFSRYYLKLSESVHRLKTTKILKTILNQFIEHCGNLQLHDITTSMVSQFLINKTRVSLHTAEKYRAYLHGMFTRAIEDGYLEVNPVSKIKKFRTPEKAPTYFTKQQFNVLLDTIDDTDIQDLTKIALFTACRQMELLTLRWSQVDFRNGLLHLDNRTNLTKSGKTRSIPLNEDALQILTSREINKHSDYVFTYHGTPIKQDFISHKFKKYIRKAGLPDELNFHSIRHTSATHLAQSGASIYLIQQLLGHSSPQVTSIYAHVGSSDLRALTSQLSF